MKITQCKTWKEFLVHAKNYKKPKGKPRDVLFRGHADANWKLKTTLERKTSAKIRTEPEYYSWVETKYAKKIKSFRKKFPNYPFISESADINFHQQI